MIALLEQLHEERVLAEAREAALTGELAEARALVLQLQRELERAHGALSALRSTQFVSV
jgi:hypothetical protein